MKYIKELNINFNNWDEVDYVNNKHKFLIFQSSSSTNYIGLIIKSKKTFFYQIKLLSVNDEYGLDVIYELNNYPIDVNYDFGMSINFKKLDRDKILIVGIDYSKDYIINNPDEFIMDNKNYYIKDLIK